MNVSLTPELDSYVQEKVQTGMYHSASEVIREGLRLLKEQDLIRDARLQELRSMVKEGFDQIDRGEYLEFHSPAEITAHIVAEGRRRLAAKDTK
jgi:antitoxin ParD1/3/4